MASGIGHLEWQLPPFLEGRRDERGFMWLLRRFIDPRYGGSRIVGKQGSLYGRSKLWGIASLVSPRRKGWLGAWEWFWSWIRSNPPCWAPSPASRSVLNTDHRSCLPESAVPCVKLPRGVPVSHPAPSQFAHRQANSSHETSQSGDQEQGLLDPHKQGQILWQGPW